MPLSPQLKRVNLRLKRQNLLRRKRKHPLNPRRKCRNKRLNLSLL
jgi:hypothetical protein